MGDGITYASGPGVNPISGCLHDCHSEKCWLECWARAMARRQRGRNGYQAGAESFAPTMHPDKIGVVRKRRKPQTIPIGFMGDMFCGDFSWDYLDKIFQDMEEADWHTYLILTKRIDNALEYIEHWLDTACWEETGCPIYGTDEKLRQHIRIGTSVLTQKDADRRLPTLRLVQAKTLWVSYEPALELVKFSEHLKPNASGICPIKQIVAGSHNRQKKGKLFTPDVARSVLSECREYGVGFYLKQMWVDGVLTEKPSLDGRQWLEEPQVIQA